MAVGSVSMLGVTAGGAQSTLNADLIDQLKEADKSALTKPMQDQLTKVYAKQSAQQQLAAQISAFKDAVSAFSSDLTYLKRTVGVSGDAISVTAIDGAELQDFKIRVDQLARNSVVQFNGSFASESAIFNKSADEMTMKIVRKGDADSAAASGGTAKSLDIKITAGMTLSEVRDAINESGDGKMTATILNVGGGDPYRLVVKSKETGEAEELTISFENKDGDKIVAIDADGMQIAADSYDADGNPLDANGDKITNGLLNFDSVQKAQDAKFQYNGMDISRSSNKITDLISGVAIELKKEDSVENNVSVSRDLSSLTEQMQAFVDSYNETMKMLAELTKYDTDTGESGNFQGDNTINAIKTEINRILNGNDTGDQGLMKISSATYSIDGTASSEFAFELSEKGTLSFNSRVFEKALNDNPDQMETLLRGTTTATPAEVAGTTVSSGTDKNFAPGDLIINGIAIGSFSYSAADTASANAQKTIAAINAVSAKTGVYAKIGGAGDNVILYNKTGEAIIVAGALADEVGLKKGSYSGSTTSEDGIFSKLNDYIESISGFGESATLTLLGQSLTNDATRLTDGLQKSLNRINAKYEIMTAQFAAYNAIISKMQSSFNAVQQMIDQAANAKNQ